MSKCSCSIHQASASKREPFIRLYSTLRTFDADLEKSFNLQLEYRDAHGHRLRQCDGARRSRPLPGRDRQGNDEIVLPRSRDIRDDAISRCAPTKPHAARLLRVRTDTASMSALHLGSASRCSSMSARTPTDEQSFFKLGLESHQLQAHLPAARSAASEQLRDDRSPTTVERQRGCRTARSFRGSPRNSTSISRGCRSSASRASASSSVAAIASGTRWRRTIRR